MQPRDLSSHVAYQAGGGIEEVARELGRDPSDLVKLASNENPLGPSPDAVEAIRSFATSMHSYPKASHADLTEAIADRWSVDPGRVWLANGGDGAIDYLSRAMLDPGQRILVPKPGFAYYAMSARFHHGEVDEYTLSKADDFAQDADVVLSQYDGQRMVYLISPHNPSGAEFSLDAIERIADETDEETLVVVDEAYGEFTDTQSAVRLADARDDVAVVRTFSKAYGLAGVRLGYALVPAAWADAYAKVNTPFAASELACRAGLAAIADHEHVERSVESARWSREYLYEHVDAPTYESGGNFVLVDVGAALDSETAAAGDSGAGTAVAEALKRRGIIVRDTTSFGLPECVRISCGTESETRRAVEELNEVLGE